MLKTLRQQWFLRYLQCVYLSLIKVLVFKYLCSKTIKAINTDMKNNLGIVWSGYNASAQFYWALTIQALSAYFTWVFLFSLFKEFSISKQIKVIWFWFYQASFTFSTRYHISFYYSVEKPTKSNSYRNFKPSETNLKTCYEV